MPTSYTQADEDVTDLLAEIMAKFHPLLTDQGVRVGVLLAANEDGVPIKHAGYPALATVKVVALKDRVTKGYDAELLLDEHEWESMSPEARAALLDHELSHLALVRVPEAKQQPGESPWQRDDLGRPKLKTKPGDIHYGDAFAAVIGRHGWEAHEAKDSIKLRAFVDGAVRDFFSRQEAGDDDASEVPPAHDHGRAEAVVG